MSAPRPFRLVNIDPRRREGELLWPARMDEAVVHELERRLGDFGTAGQLQQRPAPRGGGIVRREHFRFYRSAEAPGDYDFVALSVDAAFKDAATSSYVVIQLWGRSPPRNYLLAQVRERLTFTKTAQAILRMRAAAAHAVNVTLIEDKANGPAIIDVLRRTVPGVLAVEPRGSKPARAEAVAPLIQAGNVYVPDPQEQPWAEGFVGEWCSVPSAAFWDQVDASTQYLVRYGHAMRASVGDALVVGSGGAERADGVSGARDAPWASGVSGGVMAELGVTSPWD